MNEIKINQYLLQEEIGCGSYGKVFKGYDTRLVRVVAIKLIALSKEKKDEENNRNEINGLKEARVLARINHPHIVTIHEIFQFNGHNYLVMEFVQGKTLTQYSKDKSRQLSEIITLASKIINALNCAHQLGIIHGDLKPDNIMITTDGEPKLIDFGLSQLVSQENDLETLFIDMPTNHTVEGTLAYISPEVIEGQVPSEQADMFSLGIILYELLTGKNPFKGQTNLDTMNKILTLTPDNIINSQPKTPANLNELLNQMLNKSACKRPNSMEEIQRKLHQQSILKDNIFIHCIRLINRVKNKLKIKKIRFLAALILSIFIALLGNQLASPHIEKPLTSSELVNQSLTKLKAVEKKYNVKEAIYQLQQSLLQEPDSAAAYAALSIAKLNSYSINESNPELLNQARTNAKMALKLDTHLALSHSAMAWVHEFTGEDQQAELAYQKALSLDPVNFFTLEGYGRYLNGLNKNEQAIAIFKLALSYYPQESLFYNALGQTYYKQQAFTQAKLMFEKAIATAPNNIFGYINLAAVYYMQNDLARAIHITQQGLQIRPHAISYSNLGSYFFTLGQYPQAVKAFEQALSIKGNSNNYILWANLADAYRWSPQHKTKAIAAYQQALIIIDKQFSNTMQDSIILSQTALFQVKANIPRQAEISLAKTLQLFPTNASVLYSIAMVQELLGQRTQALTTLEKVLQAGYPLSVIQAEPELAQLRQDSGYQQLILNQHSNK